MNLQLTSHYEKGPVHCSIRKASHCLKTRLMILERYESSTDVTLRERRSALLDKHSVLKCCLIIHESYWNGIILKEKTCTLYFCVVGRKQEEKGVLYVIFCTICKVD